MGPSRNASIALAPGHRFAAAEAGFSGPFTVRLAIATLAGPAAAALVAGSPVGAFVGALVLGSSLLLFGLAALTAGALRHRGSDRGSHRSKLTSGRIAESQGSAFLLWFAGHAAGWAGALVLAAAVALRTFGPAGLVLVGASGCAAAAAVSLSGLAGIGPLSMLGLCWERRGPSPPSSRISRAETALVLRSRFLDACERDAATARKSGRLSTFTRLQIALDLARTGRSGPRVRLQAQFGPSALDEVARRAPALGLAALPAMLITFLLALFGLLGLPPAFDPQSWPSIAALSSTADPGPEHGDETAPAAADPAETADDDEASIEPTEDPSRYDPPSPAGDETGQQEKGAPEGHEPEKGSSAGEEGSSSGTEGSESGTEGSESGTEGGNGTAGSQGERSSSSGEAGAQARGNDTGETGTGETGSEEAGSEESRSGEAGSGESSSGDTGSGESGSGETDSGDTGSGDTGSGGNEPSPPREPSASPSPGGTPDAGDGRAESPGESTGPGQGSSGGGEGREAPEAGAGRGGAGSGRDEKEAKDAWGLGSGSPLGGGKATSLEPPAASDVITLHLPVLGSQTVRLEDEEVSPSAAADAPAGPRGRRGPGEPLEERAEPDPSPPQQPLPAWIVRLLRGEG